MLSARTIASAKSLSVCRILRLFFAVVRLICDSITWANVSSIDTAIDNVVERTFRRRVLGQRLIYLRCDSLLTYMVSVI